MTISPDAAGDDRRLNSRLEPDYGGAGGPDPDQGEIPTMVDVPEIKAADLKAVKDEVQVAVSTPIGAHV